MIITMNRIIVNGVESFSGILILKKRIIENTYLT